MQKVEPDLKMVKARTAIVLEQPFFGTLALRLPLVPDPTCKTMWVDGVHMGYNPTYIDSLPFDELKGSICHEIMHVANGHHVRMQGRDPKKWNRAADYPVNNAIKSCDKPKIYLPAGVLVDQYEGLSAEAVYARLPDDPKGDDNKPGDQPGQQPPPPGGQGQPQPGDGDGQGDQPDMGCGEVRPYPGPNGDGKPTEAELSNEEQDWKIATQQALKAAKACGKLPGELERMIEGFLEPKIDWKAALQQFVAMLAKNDYTFSKPNRRFLHTGFILPSLYNQVLPPMVVAVDTSCSVSEEELRQAAAEIDDIMGQYPTTIHAVYCDTRVRHTETFTMDDRPVHLDARGGGGTNFYPVFDFANDLEEQPCCLIYFTDLECDDFGPEPDYPVLWIQTAGRKREVPFGTVIRISED